MTPTIKHDITEIVGRTNARLFFLWSLDLGASWFVEQDGELLEEFDKYNFEGASKLYDKILDEEAEKERRHLAEVEAGIPFEFKKKPKQEDK